MKSSILSGNFLLVLITQITYGLCFSTFYLLPKFMTLQLKASASDIGNLMAAYGLSMLAGYILLGKLIDRYGRKMFIILGAAISALSAAGFVWIDHIGWLLFLLRVLQGFAFASIFTAAATLITDITPQEHLGRALGFYGTSVIATNGISPYVFEPVADNYGWIYVFIFSAVLGFLGLVISFFIKEHTRSLNTGEVQGDTAKFPIRRLLSILFCLIASGSAFNVMFTYYQPFALKLGINRLSGFFIGFTITSILARVFLSGLSDRFNRRNVAASTLVLYGATVVSMAWLRPGVLEIIGASLGLSHGLFYTVINAYAMEGVSAGTRGRVMAFFNGSFNIGFTFGVWLLGPVIEFAGYRPVFVGSGLTLYIALALLLLMKKM